MSWMKTLLGLGKGSKKQQDLQSVEKRTPYKGNLDEAIAYIKKILKDNDDLEDRPLRLAGKRASMIFIQTIVEKQQLMYIIQKLQNFHQANAGIPFTRELVTEHVNSVSAKECDTLEEAITNILAGLTVLFIEGEDKIVVLNTISIPKRTPEKPDIETSTRGTQIGLVENGEDNIALIRSRIKDPSLKVKKFTVGKRSCTSVYLCYMDSVANPVAVETAKQRIQAIDVDMVNQSSDVEMRIKDMHYTPFPLTRPTSRVDNISKEIGQGKFAIVVDGDPTAVLAPATLQDFYQTMEDYGRTFWEASFIRWLRVISFIIALLLPSLYVALTEYNPEFLPLTLSLRIAESRAGVPFPAVIEVFMMELIIEILREATLRMPSQMGQTIGIVGGLVIGQATVAAGLVSNILIVIIASTAVASFVPPSYEIAQTWRLCKYFVFLCTCLLGFYGMLLSNIVLLYHVASLKSFGVDYLAPLGGRYFKDWSDTFIRLPLWRLTGRSDSNHPKQDKRADTYKDPLPHPELNKPEEEWND
ncbi:spore germination protein [Pullulanibacillus sp. KACC 23026]|uniref:spore germination protein n=1 Tax=Pullulanibacillus sp. KACC 23026 TaxID=3028315 RepID=UPI0023B1241D|nr:spore germination protein [Pullulanibacillus sp. KACC 23026]WEG14371.1 spore germination protein [Pullulanibacillus sp. KACC 23026]